MSQMPKSENFVVGPVVLSYTNGLFEARSVNGGEAKFGCNILLDEQAAQTINAQVEAVGRQAFPQDWSVPNRCKKPVRVLAEKPAYTSQQDKLPGVRYFASVGSSFAPQMAGPDKLPLINLTDPLTGKKPVYGGVRAYVFINVYSYRHPQGGPGVSLGLHAVMKCQDGPELIEQGAVDVQAAFANIPAAPPAGAFAPQAYGQQPPAPQAFAPQAFAPQAFAPQAYGQQPPAPQAYGQQPPAPAPAPDFLGGGQPAGGVHPFTGQYIPPVGRAA